MDTEELIRKFAEFGEESNARLDAPKCSLEVCQEIWQEMKDEDSQITKVISDLYDANIFDQDFATEYAKLYTKVASKMAELGDTDAALNVITDARAYVMSEDSDIAKEIALVEETIKNTNKPVQQEPIVDVTQPSVVSAETDTEVNIDTPPEEPKKSYTKYIIGVAVIVAGILGVVFCPSKDVKVSYNTPVATKVVIDDKEYSHSSTINLKKGEHRLELRHPLIKFDYKDRFNVDKDGSVKLFVNGTIEANKKSDVEKMYMVFVNDILQQACSSDTMSFNSSIYTKDANNNEKISKAHKSVHNFTVKHKFKSMSVNKIEVGKIDLTIDGNDEKAIVKSDAVLIGYAGEINKIKYAINASFVVNGQTLLVSSLNSFKAEVVE